MSAATLFDSTSTFTPTLPETASGAAGAGPPPSVPGEEVIFFKKYRHVRFLAQGGMGLVYQVEHIDLGCHRALKLIGADRTTSEHARARFRIEARALAAVSSCPYIVDVHDAWMADEVAYIDMELIPGRSLKARLGSGSPATMALTTKVVMQLCEAVRFAHEAGVVHRDLKPSNIMLYDCPIRGDDSLKVLDFGVAMILGVPEFSPRRNSRVGTLLYSSPEQAGGRRVDHRTDIYSVGVIMYQLLTGHLPFFGPTYPVLKERILREEPPLFASWGIKPTGPARLERLVLSCLDKRPDRRPQSASDLATLFWNAARA